jgi:hypothetical protein
MLEGVQLTLLTGAVKLLPLPKEVMGALTRVEVTTTAGSPAGFQLSFTISTRSPLHTAFLLAAGTTPLLRVVIVVSINSTPEVLMDGVVTQHQVSEGRQAGEAVLTVTGEDLTKLMNLAVLSGLPFPATPSNLRVTALLAKYAVLGIVPFAIPEPFFWAPLPTELIPAQKGTDLDYIQCLAKEAGYVFYIEPGPRPGVSTAYWGPEITYGAAQPALNLDLDAHRNVESLSFSLATGERTLPVVYVLNKLTKFPIPVPIPKLNPLRRPLGKIPIPPTNFAPLPGTAKLPVLKALGVGVAAAAQSEDAIRGQGSLDVVRYGRLLKPRALVGVRGAGDAFDGEYFVRSVTSTLERGQCKQRFELTRNALMSLKKQVPV